jgi:hypothetical protein
MASSIPLLDTQSADLCTLSRHVLAEQRRHPEAKGDLTLLLVSIQLGCKFVSSSVRRAGLANLYSVVFVFLSFFLSFCSVFFCRSFFSLVGINATCATKGPVLRATPMSRAKSKRSSTS